MGMFDSYYLSRNFNCPCCGTLREKSDDFQSKEGDCCLAKYKLGDTLDLSRRYWDWYGYCDGKYDKTDFSKPADEKGDFPVIKAKCDKGMFWCRVFINDKGIAWKERVTMIDKDNEDEEILIYEERVPTQKGSRDEKKNNFK